MIQREELGCARLLRMAHGKASAFDLEFLRALTREFEAAEADGVSALVLTGTGNIFSAGVDLVRFRDGGADYLREFLPALDLCFERLFLLSMPTIAAVNGHAIAGGGVLTLCCDRRLMARGKTRIGLPEIEVGVPFPTLVIEIVRATLAPAVAQEVVLMSPTYDPETALVKGFVDEVVEPEQLLARASEVADRLTSFPPTSYRLSKERLRRPVFEAARRRQAIDAPETLEAWDSAEVRNAVRDYVARTLKR